METVHVGTWWELELNENWTYFLLLLPDIISLFLKLVDFLVFVLVGVVLLTCSQIDIYVFSIIDMTTVDQFSVIYWH